MARLRKNCAYRRLERPYTRISKYRKKSFVRSRPNIVISRYEMGNNKADFKYHMYLVAKGEVQIRHNALEAARQTANRLLERTFGKENYFFKLLVFPHHILRENPLAAGAGADRLSTGMKMSFGKTIATAARVKLNQKLYKVGFNDKTKANTVKTALERASKKLPVKCYIIE